MIPVPAAAKEGASRGGSREAPVATVATTQRDNTTTAVVEEDGVLFGCLPLGSFFTIFGDREC